MTTFSDLGIPFKLYRGDIKTCRNYIGKSISSISNKENEHCFKMGIGCRLKLTCKNCGAINSLDCGDKDVKCANCKCDIVILQNGKYFISYNELQEGIGQITKDTEIGMIGPEQVESGYSHGCPDKSSLIGFEVRENADGWFQAKLDSASSKELLVTPNYSTWQGERWLFHKNYPMIYCGEWNDEDFNRHRNGVPLKDFYMHVLGQEFEEMYEYKDRVVKYIFMNESGDEIRGHFDFD